MSYPNIINEIDTLETKHNTDISNVNNNLASQIQTIKSSYLPLTGGTMTGSLSFDGGETILSKTQTNYLFSIYSGLHFTDGGWMTLFGKDYQNETYAGVFRLGAINETSRCLLEGFPDGKFTWGGKPVICVSSWRSGTSWYRKYSDGWIEQGGMISGKTGMTTISYNIGFSDVNYTILKTLHWNENTGGTINRIYFGFHNRTLTTAMTYTYTTLASHREMWYACGY